jgi:hypothetical protein
MTISVAELLTIATSGVGIAEALQQAAAGLPAPSVAPPLAPVTRMVFMAALTGAVDRAGAATDFRIGPAIKEVNAALSEIQVSEAHANALQKHWSKFATPTQRVNAAIDTMHDAALAMAPISVGTTAVTKLATVAFMQGGIHFNLVFLTSGLPASSFIASATYAAPLLRMLFIAALNGAMHRTGGTFASQMTLAILLNNLRPVLRQIQQSVPQACALQLALDQGLPLPTPPPLPPLSMPKVSPTLFTQLPTSQVNLAQFGVGFSTPAPRLGASSLAKSEMFATLMQSAATSTAQVTVEQMLQKLTEQLNYISMMTKASHQIAINAIKNMKS